MSSTDLPDRPSTGGEPLLMLVSFATVASIGVIAGMLVLGTYLAIAGAVSFILLMVAVVAFALTRLIDHDELRAGYVPEYPRIELAVPAQAQPLRQPVPSH